MIIELNRQYQLAGLKEFKVDSVFAPDDQVLPRLSDVPMVDDAPTRSKTTSFKKKDRKDSYLSSNSTDFQSSQHSTSGDRQKELTSFQQVMHDRWQKANANIPEVDQKDILEENPVFNSGKKKSPEHQHHPEFSQSSYLRLRSIEEAFLMRSYFTEESAKKKDTGITEHLRSYGIQKIFDLHQKKDYKEETLFIAAAIFDRYINIVGVNNFPKNKIVHLSTIAVLMSAKLEQPISPSFTRMINLLNAEEKKVVTKQSLIDLEADILVRLGFDFNFPGPMQSLERFMRLLGYDLN